jgi:hypothetical protein
MSGGAPQPAGRACRAGHERPLLPGDLLENFTHGHTARGRMCAWKSGSIRRTSAKPSSPDDGRHRSIACFDIMLTSPRDPASAGSMLLRPLDEKVTKGPQGAAYIELFCGPGRICFEDTGEFADGSPLIAYDEAAVSGTPSPPCTLATNAKTSAWMYARGSSYDAQRSYISDASGACSETDRQQT